MFKSRAFHPFLFATFPILFLYGENIARVTPMRIVLPLLVSLGVTAVFFGLFSLVLRDVRRAAFVTSTWVLLFFTYGHVQRSLEHRAALLAGPAGADRILAVFFIVGAVVTALSVRADRGRWTLTPAANIVAAVLVVVSLIPVATFLPGQLRAQAFRDLGEVEELGLTAPDELPDIYYIMPDRYGGQRSLQAVFDFDNSEFLSELEQRGFYIAEDSRTNYPTTSHVTPAALSMEFVHDQLDLEQVRQDDWTPLYELIENHRMAPIMQSLGYRYVHSGFWWQPTARNPQADINYIYDSQSEFTRLVTHTTMLRILGPKFGETRFERMDARRLEYNRIFYQLETAKQSRSLDGPIFAFIHLPLPHSPFLADADGNFIDLETQRAREHRDMYRDYVRFTNDRLLEVIDVLLAPSGKPPPVIIIQADEGENPIRKSQLVERFDWREATSLELAEKFWILTAIHMPGVDHEEYLYPSISPVNTFRVVLNAYFGAGLELLPDTSYVFGDDFALYTFTDVTDRLIEDADPPAGTPTFARTHDPEPDGPGQPDGES